MRGEARAMIMDDPRETGDQPALYTMSVLR